MAERYIVMAPWIVLGIVWAVLAPFANKTVRRESFASRLSYVGPLALGGWLLFSAGAARLFPMLLVHIGAGNQALWWIGAILDYGGMAFTLWARFTLGKLWSGSITLKEGHRLVQSGPFAVTRHPIYTGIVVAAFGCALIEGSVRGLVAIGLLIVGFAMKLTREEHLLASQFGDEHRDYRARVRRLIPFVW